MRKVIGIHGRARSGKDSVGRIIVSEFGGYTYAFADPFKDMLACIGVDLHQPFWDSRKEVPIPEFGPEVTPRMLMQTLGTEWGRKMISENLWVVVADRNLQRIGDGMIVTDVRFENEAAWVRACGGFIIHVERPEVTVVRPHSSEFGIQFAKEHDSFIANDGTLDDLKHKVITVMLSHGYQTRDLFYPEDPRRLY